MTSRRPRLAPSRLGTEAGCGDSLYFETSPRMRWPAEVGSKNKQSWSPWLIGFGLNMEVVGYEEGSCGACCRRFARIDRVGEDELKKEVGRWVGG